MDSPLTRKKGIDAAALKLTALITMLVNHTCIVYFEFIGSQPEWLERLHWYLTRGSFVIFMFLLSEGMIHTKNRGRYMLRLAVTAAVSEVIYDLCFRRTLTYWKNQNVVFTLFAAALTVYLWDKLEKAPILRIPMTAAVCGIVYFCKFDYDIIGIITVLAFYVFRKNKTKCLVAGATAFVASTLLHYAVSIADAGLFAEPYFEVGIRYFFRYSVEEICGLAAFLPLALYNGEKGKSGRLKYGFYLAYPAHLLILYTLTSIVLALKA